MQRLAGHFPYLIALLVVSCLLVPGLAAAEPARATQTAQKDADDEDEAKEKKAKKKKAKKKKAKKKKAKKSTEPVRGPFDYDVFRVEGALGLFDGGPARVAITASMGDLELRFRGGDNFEFQLHYGFIFTDNTGTSETEYGFQSGNPYLSFLYVDRWGPVNARIGAGGTAPGAFPGNDTNINALGDVPVDRLAYATAAGMSGAWDIWIWLPETVSGVVPASFVAELGMFDVGGELGLGVLIPLFDNPVEDIGFVTQFSLLSRFVWEELSFGIRFTGVMEHLGPGNFSDRSQFALEPEVRAGLGDDGFLVFRSTIPVDDAGAIMAPRQVYCDPTLATGGCETVWGLYIGGGGLF